MSDNQKLNTTDAIANAVSAAALQLELGRLQKENELLKLQRENEALKAGAAVTPKPAETKPETAKPKEPKTVAAAVDDKTPARDKMILEAIQKYKTTDAKYLKAGRAVGTFAVKVHAYFHALGVPEAKVRSFIESAVERNVMSRMSIGVRSGGRMMLYFDAKDRPNFGNVDVTEAEKSAAADLFC